MKKNLLLMASLFAGFFGTAQGVDENGYTTANLSMGAGYANRVFFDFSENANNLTQDGSNWDIAFYRAASPQSQAFGTRMNDAKNIAVYQVSATPTDWDNISVANEASWGEPLYNPDITENLYEGALEETDLLTGPTAFGWGVYNMGNHHVEGKVIFVLKYLSAPENEQYKKLMIEDYYGGYTFKYSSWNGTEWSATQSHTVANGTSNRYFNYFSFTTNAVVADNEPEIGKWDLMFTRYWTFYGGQMMYRMSGVLQSPTVQVAKVEEAQAVAEFTAPEATAYNKGIATIGHSWKPTTGVLENVVYYVKDNDKIYRMYFTANGGTANGNVSFKYKDIAQTAGLEELNANISFGIYPNPSVDKNITLLYDLKNNVAEKNTVSIYSMTGAKVFETQITNNSGFYTKELNLSSLTSGIYIVKMESGKYSATQKLIIQ